VNPATAATSAIGHSTPIGRKDSATDPRERENDPVFGLFRYMLAFCVAISHLWSGMLGGPAAYAVWGFYCLSGFLMTLILNEKYGYSPRGLATFAVNRALRIYPGYYAVCAGMFVLFWAMPAQSMAFLPNLQMPSMTRGWIYTATLLTPFGGGELVHGSSALRVELWHYIAMALGLSRGRRITTVWWLASLAYVGWLLAEHVGFEERYVYIAACSLAFSTGAMIYHYRRWIPEVRSPWFGLGAVGVWWLHVWLSQDIPGGPWIFGLYTSLIASGLVIAAMMRLNPKQVDPRFARLDRLAGDLSYPIYLCHWGVGVLVASMVPGWSRETLPVFLVGFPIVNVVAYAIFMIVEKPLQSWKRPSVATTQTSKPEVMEPAVHDRPRLDLNTETPVPHFAIEPARAHATAAAISSSGSGSGSKTASESHSPAA
jgi:peptidoglycan/LPS O-acetylase OafA/YrhL